MIDNLYRSEGNDITPDGEIMSCAVIITCTQVIHKQEMAKADKRVCGGRWGRRRRKSSSRCCLVMLDQIIVMLYDFR